MNFTKAQRFFQMVLAGILLFSCSQSNPKLLEENWPLIPSTSYTYKEDLKNDNKLFKSEEKKGWQLLFNGKNLEGWKVGDNAASFSVEKGSIKVNGPCAHLFYIGKDGKANYKNFHLSLDVKTLPKANSGVYFHTQYQEKGWPKTGYEAQVNNSSNDPKRTASIYGAKNIYRKVAEDNKWFTYEIIVQGRRVETRINGQVINCYFDNKKVNFRGWPGRKLSNGTIALQAHDPNSIVFYKNIKILPLKIDNSKWYNKCDSGSVIATTVSMKKNLKLGVACLKGQVIHLDQEKQNAWVFDTELMNMTGFFSQGLVLYGAPWNGSHEGQPYPRNGFDFINSAQPGWANDSSFADPRPIPHGPLPADWVKYKGLYHHGDKVVLHYSVGKSQVYELPSMEWREGHNFYNRNISLSKNNEELLQYIADIFHGQVSISEDKKFAQIIYGEKQFSIALKTKASGLTFAQQDGQLIVKCAPSSSERLYKLSYSFQKGQRLNIAYNRISHVQNPKEFIKGSQSRWNQKVKTVGTTSRKKAAYVVDDIGIPNKNPWHVEMRFGGFDFFSDGNRAAAVTWNGDVWIVSGLNGDWNSFSWKRYALGLYETLGLKIVDDVIYVTGKDQITRLHDLNDDGEADYYENFNNDIMITKNFHEFTFDLQTDKDGNFYFAKADTVLNGGRGFAPNTAHNGVVFKVSKDGKHSEVYANGLRAPGGCAVSPTGIVTTGENEGSWAPQCKITWTTKKGQFHGVKPSIWEGAKFIKVKEEAPQDYTKPLCWLPHNVDSSGGGQVWVTNDQWGPYTGDLIHLSYGTSSLLKVMKEEVDGQIQGGVFKIPIKLSSSAMRARFHPTDKQMYVMGFRGWQTNATKLCAFQRIRYTKEKVNSPLRLHVTDKGIYITFTSKLDAELANDLESYTVSQWNYIYGPMYGTPRVSVNKPDPAILKKGFTSPLKGKYDKIDKVTVKSCRLLADGKTVFLEISDIKPCMQMQIKVDLETTDGKEVVYNIYNTIHKLGKQRLKQ